MKRSARQKSREFHAVESLKSAGDAIGEIKKDCHIFAITRGQWSMVDAILHCLSQVGRSKISIWTWTVADYEVQVINRLLLDDEVTAGTLIIDGGARIKNRDIIKKWRKHFGSESVRYVLNHAKMATIESESGLKLLLRGSMNLNFNPRFENFDLSEGGDAGFDLVKSIESELPFLPSNCSGEDIYKASKVSACFDAETLGFFKGKKRWSTTETNEFRKEQKLFKMAEGQKIWSI